MIGQMKIGRIQVSCFIISFRAVVDIGRFFAAGDFAFYYIITLFFKKVLREFALLFPQRPEDGYFLKG